MQLFWVGGNKMDIILADYFHDLFFAYLRLKLELFQGSVMSIKLGYRVSVIFANFQFRIGKDSQNFASFAGLLQGYLQQLSSWW